MKIEITGNEKEIAVLVLELQGRQMIKIDLDSFVEELCEQIDSSIRIISTI